MSFIKLIKTKEDEMNGHIERMGKWKIHAKFLSEKVKGWNHFVDMGVGEKILLLLISKKWSLRVWTPSVSG
jgi:hypothetical protein